MAVLSVADRTPLDAGTATAMDGFPPRETVSTDTLPSITPPRSDQAVVLTLVPSTAPEEEEVGVGAAAVDAAEVVADDEVASGLCPP
ncbi:MAG: hypothetical protein HQL37_15950 [Alphaproteobacteria bacterium]|nr:hypothetical protein [Alphaproteobacteria bacterium]